MSVLDTPQIFIVDASAGSGKTYAISKQFTKILFSSFEENKTIPINEILALTFTNKAANEMKQRILYLLKKIALDKFDTPKEKKELYDELEIDDDTAQYKANIFMDYILNNYNYFQIKTIDSFVNYIISCSAFKMGLSSNFQIKHNYEEYISYCLDEVIFEGQKDKRIGRLLKDFINQYIHIENRKSWFAKENIFEMINSLFYYYNVFNGTFIKIKDISEVFKLKKEIMMLLRNLKDILPENTDKRFLKSINSFLDNNNESFNISGISKYFLREKIPLTKNAATTKKIQNTFMSIKNKLKKLCEAEAYSIFNCYIDIFNLIQGMLKEISSDENIIFLEQLNKQVNVLFSQENFSFPEFYYRLATKYKYYLIDEFQDTSFIQWKNILSLIEESLSSKGTLFIVGDRKQAIYRFRGGDILLFEKISKHLRNYPSKKFYLTKNYRSKRNLVEFNNSIFSSKNLIKFINLKSDHEKNKNNAIDFSFSKNEIQYILSVYDSAKQSCYSEDDSGYVYLEIMDFESDEDYYDNLKEKIIRCVQDIKKRTSYKNICILLRNNSEVEEISSWLISSGIPVESEKTLNVFENPLIKEIISFIKFVIDPSDDISFASFITGEIWSKKTNIDSKNYHSIIFDLSNDKRNKEESLYEKFRLVYLALCEKYIQKYINIIGFLPIYEFTLSILNEFDVFRNFPQYQGYLYKLLEIIKDKEEELIEISDMLNYFENPDDMDIYVNAKESDCVKVMTIHKSKGLEFCCVIIPFLKIEVSVGLTKRENYQVVSNEENINLIRLKKDYTYYSQKIYKLYKEEYTKSFIDELNNIYVALTRAKDELYIFLNEKVSNKYNIAKFLFSDLLANGNKIFVSGVKSKIIKEKNKQEKIKKFSISKQNNWLNKLIYEFSDTSKIFSYLDVLKGNIYHTIFSFIGNLELLDERKILSYAFSKTEKIYPFYNNFLELKAKIEKIIKNPKLKKFFYVPDGQVFQEMEVVDSSGNTKIIDRVIISKEDVVVIDFKVGYYDEKYDVQVQEYKNLLRELYPNKTIKGYLLFIEQQTIKEV